MAQMRLLWWPRSSSSSSSSSTTGSTKNNGVDSTSSGSAMAEQQMRCCCGCLRKLVRKVKKQGRMLRAATIASTSRPSHFQCRYDPLSYSLNFDASGCGSLLDDGDYYQLCAFSSRFVATPRTSSTPTLPALATSH